MGAMGGIRIDILQRLFNLGIFRFEDRQAFSWFMVTHASVFSLRPTLEISLQDTTQ